MIPVVGGKLDGAEKLIRVPTFEEKGEQYILIQWEEEKVRRFVYMLAGMTPLEAIERYRLLNEFEKLE